MCMVDRPFAKGDCVVWDKGAASFEGSCVSIVFLCCLRQFPGSSKVLLWRAEWSRFLL